MRSRNGNVAFIIAMTVVLLCADWTGGWAPGLAADATMPAVRIAEFHYDNSGTDTGEAIEISGTAGTDLAGWSVVLYNGSGGASYGTRTLSGTITEGCDGRGVVVLNYPSNGIQNGSPDGIALVDGGGHVVEFLSYEGTFTAVGGPAGGLTSTDIGVSETGSEPTGPVFSLQRGADGTWSAPAANTFGACNDDGEEPPPAVVASVTISPASATITEGATRTFTATAHDSTGQPIAGVTFTWSSSDPSVATVDSSGGVAGVSTGDATIAATAPNGIGGTAAVHVDPLPPPDPNGPRFSEIHYDNAGADVGEAIEIEGPAGADLTGWTVVLYNGNGGTVYATLALAGAIPASCGGRGVVVVPAVGLQNGAPDGFALVNAGQVVEFLSYEGTMTATSGPAANLTSTDIGAAEDGSPVGQSLQRAADGSWSLAASSFGSCNGEPPEPPGPRISIFGRSVADPALPVGFEDQLFATEFDPTDTPIQTTFTWSSDAPAIASIDQNGVFRALAPGTAVLRATAADGTTRTIDLPTRIAVASTTALYVGNTEFGVPADSDPSDDHIVVYSQFTASYNPSRGTPNWVSYEIDPSHYGGEDRCDCFTFDPQLPAGVTRYTTAAYTGAGAFHGYLIDRGHLARSFDRTAGSLDNAHTFYFTNIVPQAADLNQGPWASFESYLGDLARTGGKEVFVVTGVAGSRGTLKDEGTIVIPASTWKVAVIMPLDAGLSNIADYRDLEVIAVNMPNEAGVRNVDWEAFKTTVDAIEALSGYDLLALLPDRVEGAVESDTKPPFALLDGPYASVEGSAVSMSAVASFDPNGTVVSYAWSFGDGTTTTAPAVSHAYAQDGQYTVTLVVTDNDGLSDVITTTATVSNVPPNIAAFAGATGLLPGEEYAASGSFTDPGADAWSATVDYGDGSGQHALALADKTFALSHTYQTAGVFTVTVAVADDDVTAVRNATVTVIAPSQAITDAIAMIDALLASGRLDMPTGRPLEAKLTGAIRDIGNGDLAAAGGKLQATINQIDALVRSGRLSADDAAPIGALLARAMHSIAGAGSGS